MYSTALYGWNHRILLDQVFILLYKKIDTLIMLHTSIIIIIILHTS